MSVTIGVVSPGAMGSALGRAWSAAGAGVVATVAGRSERTRSLAVGVTLLESLDEVVAASDLVVAICPPGEAGRVLDDVVAAARRTGTGPSYADLNALAPATVRVLADRAREAGLAFTDGSISGPPPGPGEMTTLYLSGPDCSALAGLAPPGLSPRVVGTEAGLASAVKMCTASVYKGSTALWAQALQTATHHGVLDVVLADLADVFPDTAARAGRLVASATSKSARFVAEMEQIALTQADAGASGELFEAMAAVYTRLSHTPLATLTPEQARDLDDLADVLARLR